MEHRGRYHFVAKGSTSIADNKVLELIFGSGRQQRGCEKLQKLDDQQQRHDPPEDPEHRVRPMPAHFRV